MCDSGFDPNLKTFLSSLCEKPTDKACFLAVRPIIEKIIEKCSSDQFQKISKFFVFQYSGDDVWYAEPTFENFIELLEMIIPEKRIELNPDPMTRDNTREEIRKSSYIVLDDAEIDIIADIDYILSVLPKYDIAVKRMENREIVKKVTVDKK